jgi:hypothetical protein
VAILCIRNSQLRCGAGLAPHLSIFPAERHAQRNLRDNCVWGALSFTIEVVSAGSAEIGSIYSTRNQLKWLVGLMNLGEKLCLAVCPQPG